MASQAETKHAHADDQQVPSPRSRPNGRPAADQNTEAARLAAARVTEAVEEVGRQSQDRALRSMQLWTDAMTQPNPLAWLAVPSGDRVASVRTAVDSGFAMIDTLLTAQRRFVDQVLEAQKRLAGSFLDNAAAAGDASRARERADS